MNTMISNEKTTISENGNFVPAEWSPQSALWVGWPSHPDLWQENLEPARGEIAAMINAVAEHQAVKVLAMGAAASGAAKNLVDSSVEINDAPFGDIWLRDTGPIFTADGRALRFLNNGWGGKYILPHDDTIGDEIAQAAGAKIEAHPFILEGGAIEQNGAGTILTTRQCVLNPNRNKGWDEQTATEALKKAFGARRICWLDDGLMNDHTDGHIDNIARFVSENHVVCPAPFGDDDPNTTLYKTMAAALNDMGFEVTQIPSPGKITDADDEIIPASHMNFIITNDVVVVPTYGAGSTDEAVSMIADLFPGRKTIGLPSTAILSGGGSFHCITQQEPQRKDAA